MRRLDVPSTGCSGSSVVARATPALPRQRSDAQLFGRQRDGGDERVRYEHSRRRSSRYPIIEIIGTEHEQAGKWTAPAGTRRAKGKAMAALNPLKHQGSRYLLTGLWPVCQRCIPASDCSPYELWNIADVVQRQ